MSGADPRFDPRLDPGLDPAGALAAMRESRAKVLDRNACPPWRHALFAALMAGVVAAQATPVRVFFAILGVLFVGMGVFYVVTKARRGVFINGWRAGATRGVSLAIFGVYLAIYSLTWWLKVEHGLWVAPLIGGAVLFPMAWYASARWMQVFRKEMAA